MCMLVLRVRTMSRRYTDTSFSDPFHFNLPPPPPQVLLSKPVLLQRLTELQQRECALAPEVEPELVVGTDRGALLAALAALGASFTPTADPARCTVEGAGVGAEVRAGDEVELVITLRDATGAPPLLPPAGVAGGMLEVAIEGGAGCAGGAGGAGDGGEGGGGAAADAGTVAVVAPTWSRDAEAGAAGVYRCAYTIPAPADTVAVQQQQQQAQQQQQLRISVTFRGVHLPGSPFAVAVQTGALAGILEHWLPGFA